MRSHRIPLFLSFALLALAPAASAAPELRFTATAPGGIIGTGNTLGLGKALNENGPGTRDSIGTFTSLDPLSVDDNPANPANPWPAGTTGDWKKNGSSAVLDLPEAEVLYAELLWGGGYLYGGEDVTADLDTPVTLKSGASMIQVTPDQATKLTTSEVAFSGFAVNYYMRSADVTNFVKQVGKGTYEVSGVPATQSATINSLNAAGWTLVVAYRDEGAATKNLSIFVGGSFVDEDSQQDYGISGFCAPPAGVVEGTVIVSTIEGDANLVGDKLQIAPNMAGPFVDLSGPNNPSTNFFCSQLNDSMGNLDTKGTFGSANQDAAAGVNVSGGRQGWDVTTVPLSSGKGQLQNSQKAATIRAVTNGDSFVPILAAFAIDVNAPDFTGAASTLTAPDEVAIGDKLTVTATLDNGGDVAAQGVLFTMPIEPGLKVVSFASDGQPGDISGGAVDAAALAAGVDEGDLPAGKSRTVTLNLEVVGPPAVVSYYLKAKWAYGFEVCANEPLIPESFSRSKSILLTGQGGSSSSGAGGNSSGNGGASGVGGNGSGNGGANGAGGAGSGASGSTDPGGDGSCSCSIPGTGEESPYAFSLGLLAISAIGARRISRRRGR